MHLKTLLHATKKNTKKRNLLKKALESKNKYKIFFDSQNDGFPGFPGPKIVTDIYYHYYTHVFYFMRALKSSC